MAAGIGLYSGCSKKTGHEKIIYIPERFTPNNDGINDYFAPRGESLVDLKECKTRICDENGLLLFTSDTSYFWDGRDEKDSIYPTGKYLYSFYFQFSDNTKERYRGVVQLN